MNDKTKLYEGLFLLDAGIDFETAKQPVEGILTRYGAEILTLKAWDERRLAYEIAGRKRGLYALAYFKADPEKIREIENDCQLDERVLRTLILHHESLSDEVINAPTPASGGVRAPEIGEREYEDRGDRWDRRDRREPRGDFREPRAEQAPADLPVDEEQKD